MSKHDSVKSADTKLRINPHDFFVPVIVMVVLCILVVATFHSKEPGSPFAGVADTGQTDKPAVDTTAVTAIDLKAPEVADASVETMKTTAISDQLIPHDQTAAAESADDAADADMMSPAQTSKIAGIDEVNSNPASSTASTNKLAADENTSYLGDTDGSGSGSHADKDQADTPMQDQRRRLYQDARQAQKAHRLKMLQYRAEVMKRIEQDRRDLYRHRHSTQQQHREHRDRYRDRVEQARNGAEDIPI
jgi:hypothetical protein